MSVVGRNAPSGRDTGECLYRAQIDLAGRVIAGFAGRLGGCAAGMEGSADRLKNLLETEIRGLDEERGRYADIVATMKRNIESMVDKCKHFKRFAGRADDRTPTFDPGEVVEEAVLFRLRAARLRRISIASERAAVLPRLSCDPLRCHFLVLLLIDDLLGKTGTGGRITARVAPWAEGVLIEIAADGEAAEAGTPPTPERGLEWSLIQAVAEDLGARLLDRSGMDGGRGRTSFVFPADPVSSGSPSLPAVRTGEASL